MEFPVQFCSHCKSILSDSEQCLLCETFNSIPDKEFSISKSFPGSQNWVEQSNEVKQASMNMPCPKCDAKKLHYTTRQTRRADEGETVFVQCKKCGYKSIYQ